MNIFILDKDHAKNAEYHNDKHVVKMILEYAQLLSGAVRISGIDSGYKLTHQNHPCAIWARESLSNWMWLKSLSKALNQEYKFRYSKQINHKSYDKIESLPIPNIKDIGLTEFRLAMPNDVKVSDAVLSYRNYYRNYKQHIATWKNRNRPEWL